MIYVAIIYFFITFLFGLKYARNDWRMFFKHLYNKPWNWKSYILFVITITISTIFFITFWPIILLIEYKERRKHRGR